MKSIRCNVQESEGRPTVSVCKDLFALLEIVELVDYLFDDAFQLSHFCLEPRE